MRILHKASPGDRRERRSVAQFSVSRIPTLQILKRRLRTIIATLQDLGFVVDKADADLGSVSATKLFRLSIAHHGDREATRRENKFSCAQMRNTWIRRSKTPSLSGLLHLAGEGDVPDGTTS